MADRASAYWWRGVPNFGDRLTPLLLSYHADLEVKWASTDTADIVCVGSVLEHLSPDYGGVIIGAGKLHEDYPARFPNAQILALRGPFSAIGVPGDYALGDPGLLACELIDLPAKEYQLGIVAHWSDTQLVNDPRFTRYDPVIIDPRSDPLEVVRTIAQCKKIVSSSLHGLVVADSFAIPRRFEYTPRFDAEGGTLKFRDYHSAIKTPFVAGKTIEASRFGVDDCRFALHDAFRELAARVRAAA
jgi:polysaccharide pyruvyl transferase